jgi:hypothetical protein
MFFFLNGILSVLVFLSFSHLLELEVQPYLHLGALCLIQTTAGFRAIKIFLNSQSLNFSPS